MDHGSKLEPFLLLVKNARGKAAADLILKVTSEPSIFAFSELLQFPGIKELQGSELDAAWKLLIIFCYGTWTDYKGLSSQLQLNAAQASKLKQLTVVSMAGNAQKLRYDDLMAQLDIDNVRDLEDLLISECFYSGLISGKLDQKERCLYVSHAAARDVRPEEVQGILERLLQWLQRSKDTLAAIEGGIQNVQSLSTQTKEAHVKAEEEIAQAKTRYDKRNTSGGGDMEIEEPVASSYKDTSSHRKGPGREAGAKRRR